MSFSVRRYVLVVSVASLAACGGPTPPKPEPAQVRIAPNGVLLTPDQPTRSLTAVVLDQNGVEMSVPVTWSSTDPSVIAVDADGITTADATVTANASVGAAQVTASVVGGAVSGSITVVAAVPVPGAVVVGDEQVLSDPEPLDPEAGFDLGVLYAVELAGAPPAVGSILMATGEAPVAGRVHAVDGAVVTIEVVALDELFSELEIDQSIELGNAELLPAGKSDAFALTRARDGTLIARSREGAVLTSDGGLQPQVKFGAGPFQCESDLNFASLSITNVSVNFTPNLALDVVVTDTRTRLVLTGNPTATAVFEPVIKVGLQESVECMLTFATLKIPLPGPLGLVLGAAVPVGVGFELEGNVPLADVGVHVEGQFGATFQGGFDCNPNCTAVTSFTPSVTGKLEPIVPGLQGLKIEPSLYGYAIAKLEAGVHLTPALRIETVKIRAGLKLDAKLAGEETQRADPGYASEYTLDLVGVISGGKDIQSLANLLKINITSISLTQSINLARSPRALSITADRDQFGSGDTVTFTVGLDPGTVSFPVVGYNVVSVRVYDVSSGSLVLANEVTATPGQESFEIAWVASRDGTVGNDFVAYLASGLLPSVRLELGEASASGGTANVTFSEVAVGQRSDPTTSVDHEVVRSGSIALQVISQTSDLITFAFSGGSIDYDEEYLSVSTIQLQDGFGCLYDAVTTDEREYHGGMSVDQQTPGDPRIELGSGGAYDIFIMPAVLFSASGNATWTTTQTGVNGPCTDDGVISETDPTPQDVSSGFYSTGATQDPSNPNVFSGSETYTYENPFDHVVSTITVSWTLTLP